MKRVLKRFGSIVIDVTPKQRCRGCGQRMDIVEETARECFSCLYGKDASKDSRVAREAVQTRQRRLAAGVKDGRPRSKRTDHAR